MLHVAIRMICQPLCSSYSPIFSCPLVQEHVLSAAVSKLDEILQRKPQCVSGLGSSAHDSQATHLLPAHTHKLGACMSLVLCSASEPAQLLHQG